MLRGKVREREKGQSSLSSRRSNATTSDSHGREGNGLAVHVEQRCEVQATFHERKLAIRGAGNVGNRKESRKALVGSLALKVKKGEGNVLAEILHGTAPRIRICKRPRPPTLP